MDATDKKILDNYLGLLEKLTPNMKLKLIDRLKVSVKSRRIKQSTMRSAFGAWNQDESAEELIDTIYKSRNTNRNIEEF